MDANAELIRKKYLYRRLIMQRKLSLHHRSAAGLIGPDCAYHLYGQFRAQKSSVAGVERSGKDEADAA